MKNIGIQSLRGIAAFAVVLHHLDVLIGKDKYFGLQLFGQASASGFRGVDLFFVISGFIMMHTIVEKPNRSRKQFVTARISRIFIPYLPIFVVMLTAYIVLPSITQSGIEVNSTFIIQNLLLLPRSSIETYVPVVAWTLTFEITFYLIFALTFFRASKISIIVFITWMALCLLNIWAKSPLWILSPLNIGFGIGILSFMVKDHIPMIARSPIFVLSAFGFIVLMMFDGDRPDSAVINMVYLLISGCLCATSTQIPKNPFSRVGDFSYSLYLCHYPILALLFIVAFKTGVGPAIGPVGLAAVATIVCFVGSIMYYRLFEVYVFNKVRDRLKSS